MFSMKNGHVTEGLLPLSLIPAALVFEYMVLISSLQKVDHKQAKLKEPMKCFTGKKSTLK